MSNSSLKEQLEAAAFKLVGTSEKKKTILKKQKSAMLDYFQYGVELLKAHFPCCFKDPNEIQPLKVGIKQDLVKRLGGLEDVVINDKACMIKSLNYYVNTIAYHKRVLVGTARVDLDGNAVGMVTAEEALYAEQRRQHKQQSKVSA
ncbi:MAG: hypothetical protein A3E83_00485 [Gammaproteobacteria bacterium RIFCSPHIGHO2_12_FULL_41_20]|nr:MAG: hypothetical protein A3E83_00485 [Gammaproteobacteria bacterium RIFCSPHIGHO2_12_FULL_41_20]